MALQCELAASWRFTAAADIGRTCKKGVWTSELLTQGRFATHPSHGWCVCGAMMRARSITCVRTSITPQACGQHVPVCLQVPARLHLGRSFGWHLHRIHGWRHFGLYGNRKIGIHYAVRRVWQELGDFQLFGQYIHIVIRGGRRHLHGNFLFLELQRRLHGSNHRWGECWGVPGWYISPQSVLSTFLGARMPRGRPSRSRNGAIGSLRQRRGLRGVVSSRTRNKPSVPVFKKLSKTRTTFGF